MENSQKGIENYVFDILPNKNPRIIKRCINLLKPEEQEQIYSIISHNNTYLVSPSIWDKFPIDRKILIESFEEDVENLEKLNNYIVSFPHSSPSGMNLPLYPEQRGRTNNIRIVTFNVHYWTNIHEDHDFFDQLKVISKIDADIVCLQEALFPRHGNTVKGFAYNKPEFTIEKFWSYFDEYLGLKYHNYCIASFVHSEQNTAFGNIILSKIKPKNNVYQTNTINNLGDIDQGRCFSYVQYKAYDVYNTHLDIFDRTGNTRLEQIESILKFIQENSKNKSVVLLGDLNSLYYNDYLPEEQEWLAKNKGRQDDRVINAILEAGFVDVFPRNKYSVWSGRRVDYIWVRGDLVTKNSYAYYTNVSDHFPLIADLNIFRSSNFSWLLWTHNTSMDTGIKMMSGEYTNIKCCTSSNIGKKIKGRGAQFRWGLDSQYGDFKIIMRPDFWRKYNKGVDPFTQEITSSPKFVDFWDGKVMSFAQAEKLLKNQASKYTYRSKSGHPGQFNLCDKNEREMYTWCNIQLHIGENVEFEDIAFVLVPAFLENNSDISKYNTLEYTPGTTIANPFKNKLIFAGSDNIENYYEWVKDSVVHPNIEEYFRFFGNISTSEDELQLSSYDSMVLAVKLGMLRDPRIHGSSSRFAMNLDSFRAEEKEYINLLNIFGF